MCEPSPAMEEHDEEPMADSDADTAPVPQPEYISFEAWCRGVWSETELEAPTGYRQWLQGLQEGSENKIGLAQLTTVTCASSNGGWRGVSLQTCLMKAAIWFQERPLRWICYTSLESTIRVYI